MLPTRACATVLLLAAWTAASVPASGDNGPGTSGGTEPFADPTTLQVSAGAVEHPDAELLAWGRSLLGELEIDRLAAVDAARALAEHIHANYAFTPDRPPSLAAFRESRAGNCYAHARLGAFLLRLAGIPARFVYEVHLENKDATAAEAARERGIGLFGRHHNDHFWVLYRDGDRWVPFDSSLGIADFESFRRLKIDAPAGGVANPPFLLWRQAAGPEFRMENFTRELWRQLERPTVPGVAPRDWQRLLDTLGRLAVEDLMQPLSPEREAEIAAVARPFFAAVEASR